MSKVGGRKPRLKLGYLRTRYAWSSYPVWPYLPTGTQPYPRQSYR